MNQDPQFVLRELSENKNCETAEYNIAIFDKLLKHLNQKFNLQFYVKSIT